MPSPRTCAIHQPNLFPRLSTLAKLYAADVWVVLDDVQLNMRDYQHRTPLLSPDMRQEQWLSLPVHRPFGRSTRINEALLLDQAKSARRVSELIRQYYGQCRQWPALRPIIDAVAAEVQLSNYLVDTAECAGSWRTPPGFSRSVPPGAVPAPRPGESPIRRNPIGTPVATGTSGRSGIRPSPRR